MPEHHRTAYVHPCRRAAHVLLASAASPPSLSIRTGPCRRSLRKKETALPPLMSRGLRLAAAWRGGLVE